MSEKKLIIVESPSKIKTLKKFLGDEYGIEASVGHIRDLPKKNLGLDLENGFTPTYEVSPDSKKTVKQLKSAAKNISELYIATDPDREGEAIAWHLIDELKPKVPIKRMVFNEITKKAVLESLQNTRDIDMNLVNAQECRRFLDRLFGFLVSNELRYNVKNGLSAGRVQSPAVKILVDREKLRTNFSKSEYWNLEGNFKYTNEPIFCKLASIQGQKLATGASFNRTTGALEAKNTTVLSQQEAEELNNSLSNNQWKVLNIENRPLNQNPYPPFITSTLQQEGIRKLRMSSRQVMSIAQSLYQSGYITYMRTDSINLSNEAINAAKNVILKKYGKDYLPDKPRIYKSKSKNTQEAHEAIRPAGSTFTDPETLKPSLSDAEYKVYNMIWKRTVASQMKSAKTEQTKLEISDNDYIFNAHGKTIIFPGFLRAYVEGADNPDTQLDDMEKTLPKVSKGDIVEWDEILPKQHFTKPMSRFTEASLVKELETLGIGRPSTYATIMQNIQTKGYVNKVKGAMIPTFIGYAVVQFLEKYYQDLVNLQYTSTMENELDKISVGEVKKENYLNSFYFTNNEHIGLKDKLEQEYNRDLSRLITTIKDDNNEIEIRIGRYGLYAQIGENRVTIENDAIPSEITSNDIQKMLNAKNVEPTQLGMDQQSGNPILFKKGRFGPYVQCGNKMKSLPPGITEDNLDEAIAAKIIEMPFELGINEESNEKIIKDIGRYGPYIRCGKITRKVAEPDNILDLSLERAKELLKNKSSNDPEILKELGKHNDLDISIKNGRYGVYLTNGKVNVTLKNIDYNNLDLNTAIDMISKKNQGKKFKRK
tara:strand:- start:13449 stop:15914 length:2466 start_codon:yes stop_codon:yes gene_type:complete